MVAADFHWDSARFPAAVTHGLEQHKSVPTALAGQKRSSWRPAADQGGKAHLRGFL